MTDTETAAEAASLGEEIRQLVEMVLERAAPWLEEVIAAGHGSGQDENPDRDEAPGCGWCPLCAVVSVVRGERPEFATRVLEQARQLIALLRAVLADRWEPEEGVHMPGFQRSPRPSAERVQHIPVRWQED